MEVAGMEAKKALGIRINVAESREGGYVGWAFIDNMWMLFQADSLSALQTQITTGLTESSAKGALDPARFATGIIDVNWVENPPMSYGLYHKNPFEIGADPNRDKFFVDIADCESFWIVFNAFPSGNSILAPKGRLRPELHYQLFKRMQETASEPSPTNKQYSFDPISRAWHQAMRK